MRDTTDPGVAARTMLAALSGSSITVAELDDALRYTAVHSPGVLLQGREALGRTAVEIHGPAGEPLMELARRALASGDSQVARAAIDDQGLTRHLELRITPIRNDGGAARLALLAVERPPQASDTVRADPASERVLKQMEELRRGRDLLRTIFEGLHDGLLLLDCDGSVLAANTRASALLNLPGELLPGRSWGETIAGRHDLPITCVGASLDDGQARRERVRLPGDEGQRTVEIQTMPVHDDRGELERLLVHICDMTEKLQLEAQMIDRERFVATGRLAATVAHEVNTPLQAIESCLHLAGRVDDPADRARYLRLAREEIKRVGYTMRELLDLYRPNRAPAPLDVNGLIERVLLLTGNSLSRRSIQIERDLSSDLPVVVGRADEMTQVLINLVFNAMQAMPKGGRLRLESARATCLSGLPCLVIRVRDTGVGIAPELHHRIFEPFFTTRPDGTGLGLAICQRIVEGHGGALQVESAPDAGSCFIIEIPVA